jgi:hypothetical protein
MEETGVPGENHRPVASHWQTLSHNVVSSAPFLILFANKSTTSNESIESMWRYTYQMMIYISYSPHYSRDNKNELEGWKSYRQIKTWTYYSYINVAKNFLFL